MTRLRTTFAAVGVGTAVIVSGAVVASNAMATPTPVAAVTEATAADPASAAATDAPTVRPATRRWWDKLTDEQRTCLQGQGITRPVGRLDDAERAALRAKVEAAAATCEVTLPFAKARAFWDGLTDEQRTCLKEAAVNRPWGPLTKEQRQQVRADLKSAAQKCGVTPTAKTPAAS